VLSTVAHADGPGNTVADAANSTVATAPSLYWGAYVRGWPADPTAIDKFEANAGKRMSIIHWGQPWSINGKLQKFQNEYFDFVRQRGGIPLLDWGSTDNQNGLDQPDFALATITRGDWDSYITSWADSAAAWGHPLFLRFDAEMNGWWLPWSEQVNANNPGDFAAAWRHVHDIFVQEGATNVSWVWCINEVSPYSTPTASLYPGDSYVDWTCMDGYNWGTDRDNAWQTFSQVLTGDPRYGGHNTYQEVLGVAPTKPMMIGETASSENGGSKAAWISDLLEAQLPAQFPMVKALVWFEHGNPEDTSWAIATSAQSLAAFKEGIGNPVYASNAYGTLDTSPIPPPEALAPKAP